MALQTSGQISLNDLHVEAGGSSGTQCSFNDSDIRDLIDKGSGAQSAMNEFYGASSVTAPVWNGSTYTFDLGTPDVIHTKTGNFTLAYNGAVAIIAIGGGGSGAKNARPSNGYKGSGGGGGGVAIKGLIGTTSMSFTASRGSGTSAQDTSYADGDYSRKSGGATTVSGNGISLTANGGTGGIDLGINSNAASSGGSASGGDANYTGGSGPNPPASNGALSGGGGAGGGNGSTSTGGTFASGGTSPLDTGWLASYIGSGGNARQYGWPTFSGGAGGSYGGGGGAGAGGSSTGGAGADGIILVCYWT